MLSTRVRSLKLPIENGRTVVRRTLRRSPDATIVVTGCYAQLQPEEIAAIEGVRLVVGNAEKHQLGLLVERARSAPAPMVIRTEDLRSQDVPFTAAVFSEHDSHTRAFLKLQDGCDYSCSFCTIPHARGKSRSMPFEEIPQHVRRLVEAGYREIVLTGINLGEYRGSKGERLLDVLELLDSLEFECRYRLSSVEPNRMHPAIIEFIAQHPSICPHFHLPLQSGSPEILRQMRRRYKRELYAERVLAIKERMTHACIGADVLTGFPGESERHFEETYRFIESLPLSYLHVFTYSERELTDAARRRDQVPLRIRKERTAALRALGQQKRELFAAENIGTRRNVLIEQLDPTHGGFVGYSENYCRVVVQDALPGALVEVEILRCDGELLSGTVRSSTGQSRYVGLPVLSLGG